jgi:hypothetical protein
VTAPNSAPPTRRKGAHVRLVGAPSTRMVYETQSQFTETETPTALNIHKPIVSEINLSTAFVQRRRGAVMQITRNNTLGGWPQALFATMGLGAMLFIMTSELGLGLFSLDAALWLWQRFVIGAVTVVPLWLVMRTLACFWPRYSKTVALILERV